MKVRGSIDESEISKINLMQNENGTLILPVKVFVITVKEFAFEFLF